MRIFLITLLLMFGTQAVAQQAGDKARLASAHWWCYYLIGNMNADEIIRRENASNHHFKKGYEYVLEMHEELNKHGEKNRYNWDKHAPAYFNWYRGGPSVEFSAGRLFQATEEVVDEYWSDPFNKKLETMTVDKVIELRQVSAESAYVEKNCDLLN